MFTFTEETDEDWWEVEALFDTCFAPGREALSSYRLRDGVEPVAGLCVLARDETGAVAGAIRYWPVCVRAGERRQKALLLGPVAIHPTRQGEGLGGRLIRETLALARQAGWRWVILVGDAPYYERFGFRKCPGLEFPPPTNPDRLLALDLDAPPPRPGEAAEAPTLAGRVLRCTDDGPEGQEGPGLGG